MIGMAIYCCKLNELRKWFPSLYTPLIRLAIYTFTYRLPLATYTFTFMAC